MNLFEMPIEEKFFPSLMGDDDTDDDSDNDDSDDNAGDDSDEEADMW